MKPYIAAEVDFTVYENGEVLDLIGGDLIPPTWNGSKYVTKVKNSKGKSVEFDLAKIMLMQYSPLDEYWKYRYAYPVFIDENPKNATIENLKWDFNQYIPLFVPGINIPMNKGVTIPGYSSYTIDGLSQIYSLIKREYLKGGYINDKGYYICRLIDDKGISRLVRIHRLMAVTFLSHPVDTSELYINHKDGNKVNNSIGNLEWVTPKQNVEHALNIGLQKSQREVSVPIYVYRFDTGEIETYITIVEIAKKYKYSTTTIARWLYSKTIQRHDDIALKFSDDPRPWPSDEQEQDRSKRAGFPIIVKNLKTNEVKRYRYVSEFCREIDTDKTSVIRNAVKETPIPFKGFLITKDTGKDVSWPDYEIHNFSDVEIAHLSKTKPIVAKNVNTGMITYFNGISSFAIANKTTFYKVKNAIENGDVICGFKLSYFSHEGTAIVGS